MRTRQLLAPIAVGQLPRSMALGRVTVCTLRTRAVRRSASWIWTREAIGRVRFPPIPFNAAFALITPPILAQPTRSTGDDDRWDDVEDGGKLGAPRPLNTNVFGTVRAIPGR